MIKKKEAIMKLLHYRILSGWRESCGEDYSASYQQVIFLYPVSV